MRTHTLLLALPFLLSACAVGGIAPLDDTGETEADADADADSDADTDPQPQVDCGPYQAPSTDGTVYSGEGSLDKRDDWHWESCEVERRFGAGGVLDCELLYHVQGDYYAWDERTLTAWFELRFEADRGQSTCAVDSTNERYTVYYESTYDWDRGEMEVSWSAEPEGRFEYFVTAEIQDLGDEAPFSYVSEPF